jgi:DNA-binding transcriptional regulator YiaG
LFPLAQIASLGITAHSTLCNWERGRQAIGPAARSLLMIVARNPKAALAALASNAA